MMLTLHTGWMLVRVTTSRHLVSHARPAQTAFGSTPTNAVETQVEAW